MMGGGNKGGGGGLGGMGGSIGGLGGIGGSIGGLIKGGLPLSAAVRLAVSEANGNKPRGKHANALMEALHAMNYSDAVESDHQLSDAAKKATVAAHKASGKANETDDGDDVQEAMEAHRKAEHAHLDAHKATDDDFHKCAAEAHGCAHCYHAKAGKKDKKGKSGKSGE